MKKRIGDKPLTRYFMNSIDGMVAMSQSVLDDINKYRAELPRTLCPHPLFDNFGKKIDQQEAKYLLNLESKNQLSPIFWFYKRL